ncbi:MAG TPA: transporter substrate-binding domain-containing protein, partial [Methanoregula sp.]|nr:transporter substrate-binding domain-containing protein [Methanoregula sp.]
TGHLAGVLVIVTCFLICCGCLSASPQGSTMAATATPATDAGIRIITEEFPPLNYAGPDGKVTGQATEVVTVILNRLNRTAVIEILPWDEGYAAALAGPKVALYATGRTDEREELFKWVGPVTYYDYTLYARNGSGISVPSLEAAKTAGTIAVVRDDSRHQFLQKNNFTDIMTCDTDADCLGLLLTGTVPLWLGSSVNAPAVARKAGIDPGAFSEVYPFRTVPMYIAFSRDTPDSVIEEWQSALDSMKADGTFDSIWQKYGIGPSPVSSAPSPTENQADLALSYMITTADSRLTPVLRTYQVLAVTSEVKSTDWQNIKPLLAALEAREPEARTWYANPDGSYYTVVDDLTTASLKNRTYFPGVVAGKESVGTVVVSYSTGKNTAIVAVPVMDRGTVTGILGASVYLDTLTTKLKGEVPSSFVFYAIDHEGTFAIHSEKEEISRNIATVSPASSFGQALRTIQDQESGSVAYDDGGMHYRASFRTAPLTGWRFVVAWRDQAQ